MKRNEMKSTPGRNHFSKYFVVQKKNTKNPYRIMNPKCAHVMSNGMRAIFFFHEKLMFCGRRCFFDCTAKNVQFHSERKQNIWMKGI